VDNIVVTLQITIRFESGKRVSVGNIATAVKGLGLNQKVVETVVQKVDEELVRKYCVPKYARGNGTHRYQRAGSVARHPVTSVGRLNLTVHRLKDRARAVNAFFKPVEERIEFAGKKIYQEDISIIGAELATKMTYRDAVKEGKQVISDFPSACTINRRVIEYGERIKAFNCEQIRDAGVEVAFADGTKTHSQERGRSKNEVKVVVGMSEGKQMLLDAQVNKPWADTARTLDATGALTEEVVFIADAEQELRNALVTGKRSFQLDFIHAFRDTSYKLWQDGELALDDRKRIISTLKAILFALSNAVTAQRAGSTDEPLKQKINETVDALKSLADELWTLSCRKAASFIRDYSNALVTFAVLTVTGRKVPWNSNVIERLMGEIAKRTKHKWMRWTSRGLETLLNLLLVRYTSEESYERFKRQILKSDNVMFIRGEVDLIPAGGEF
jgi:hypothetical protein